MFVWGAIILGILLEAYSATIVDVFGWPMLFALAVAATTAVIVTCYLACFGLPRAAYYRIWLSSLWACGIEKHRQPPRLLTRVVDWFLPRFLSYKELEMAHTILASRRFKQELLASDSSRIGVYRPTVFASRTPWPIVRRRDVLRRGWPPDAVFAIAVLQSPLTICRRNGGTTLEIDLRNQRYAIYDNIGKRYLTSRFVPELQADRTQKCRVESAEITAFLRSKTASGTQRTTIPGLRWASGGALPIVTYDSRDWFCLFHRDIGPLGWNLANGGSEFADEWVNLRHLIYREMTEEVVVCDGIPTGGAVLNHYRLDFDHNWFPKKRTPADELCTRHHELRRRVDDIEIQWNQIHRRIQPIDHTSHKVHVIDDVVHGVFATGPADDTDDILIAVNPFELGVEVIRLIRFDLQPGEYILDGEVVRSRFGDYLARRPVGLVSVDFLKNRFRNNGESLGPVMNSVECLEGKDIGPVPKEHYRLFLADVDLRRRRLTKLEGHVAQTAERQRIDTWLREFEGEFRKAEDGSGLSGKLAWLLPATWKIIELALSKSLL